MVEVLIEDVHRLDVNEGFDFSFNYSIADIRTPESRQTEYSKTIVCPATHNNNLLFGHIFDVNGGNPFDSSQPNIGYNFNPNKKAKAVILMDGMPVFKGSIQLRKIPIKSQVMSYEVVLLGSAIDIFAKIRNKTINGVDDDGNRFINLSDLDHILSADNQQATWTAQIGEGYVYPLIDYGHVFSNSPTGHKAYRVDQLLPSIYVKELVDRIFDFAGFTYTSDFFGSVLWNRLILTANTGTYTLDDQSYNNLFFLANSTSSTSITITQTENVGIPQGFPQNTVLNWGEVDIPFDNEVQDLGDIYEPSTGEGTMPTIRQHQFGVRIKASVDHVTGLGSTNIYIEDRVKIYRVRNGATTLIHEELLIPHDFTPTDVGTNLDYDIGTLSPLIDVEVGDVFYVGTIETYKINHSSHTFTHTYDFDCTFYNIPRRDGIFEGETVSISPMLHDGIKMVDFLTSLIKMFNLYLEIDPSNDQNLLIEPRDDYYDNSDTIKDWTHKLDRSGNIDVTPISTVVASEYNFNYTEDGDYYNTKYNNIHGKIYGSRRVEIDNDFNKGSKDIDVIFSPTPLVNDGDSSRIIPKIYDEDVSNGAQPFGANIRLLYYGGMKPSTPLWQHSQESTWGGGAATFYENFDEYPYAGHLDDPINPNIDLSFAMPFQLFYAENGNTGQLSYTSGNLFNLYHSRHYNEITHKDGKLLTGMFRLRSLDIANLNFADLILIDNTYWRLNKIENYNPFKEGLTKVELIKVIDQPDFKAEPVIKTRGNTGSGITSERNPMRRSNAQRNMNDYDPTNGSVRGQGNRVGPDATDFIVLGDNNVIGNRGRNIFVQGNNNTVAPNLRNVTIMGTDNATVTESNTTWNNGHEEQGRGIVDGGLDTVTPLNAGTTTRVIDSGDDVVQNDSGHSDIYLIDG